MTSLYVNATLEKVVSDPTSPLLIQVVPFAFYLKQPPKLTADLRPSAEMGKKIVVCVKWLLPKSALGGNGASICVICAWVQTTLIISYKLTKCAP